MAKKKVSFNMRLNEDFIEKVREKSEESQMSMSDYFRQAVLEKFKREEKK
mgnify:FL=1